VSDPVPDRSSGHIDTQNSEEFETNPMGPVPGPESRIPPKQKMVIDLLGEYGTNADNTGIGKMLNILAAT